jgi:hypothetical protein
MTMWRRAITGFAAIVLALSVALPAHADPSNCRAITDSLERLRCFDAREDAAMLQSTKQDAQGDPEATIWIVWARNAVRKQLRDPESALFDGLRVVKDKSGKPGVCGTVNAKNAMGGMTGPKMFVFDGSQARILVAGEGAEDGTSLGRYILGATLGTGLKLHTQFCKI